MIHPHHATYLTPTKDLRRLSVLLSIHKSPHVSQHKIAKSTYMSSSMVNNYIKQLSQEGLINVSGDTNRTRSYHLSADGHNDLRESLLSYSSEIVQFYSSVKREISNILDGLYQDGIRTIVLYGAAETAEVVLAAIKKTALVLIGVVDRDEAKQGKLFNGLLIQAPDKLIQINPDAVLITSFAKQEEIYEQILSIVGDQIKIKKLSDL